MLLHIFAVGFVGFHAASLNSMLDDGPAFSRMDPILAMTAAVVGTTLVLITQHTPRVHVIVCTLGTWIITTKGVFAELQTRDTYTSSDGFHSRNWAYGVGLCWVGAAALVGRLFQCPHGRSGLRVALVLLAWSYATPPGSSGPRCNDAPWWSASDTWEGGLPGLRHLPFHKTSRYLEMSDGVKLAMDIYLPRGSTSTDANATARPTFLHFTRYRRAERRSWLTRWLVLYDQPPQPTFTLRSLRFIEHFVPDGYAYVTVDTRGAGASFGSKPSDMLPREYLDLREVSDWVVKQPWCNGKIGTGGISYDGMMGAAAAAQGNIAAVALLHSFSDVYEDVGLPGGIPATGFISLYAAFTSASERDVHAEHPDLNMAYTIMSTMFDGTAPVADGDMATLSAAVSEHTINYDMSAKIKEPPMLFKDAVIARVNETDYTYTDLSDPQHITQSLISHKVAVSSWAGYLDSGSIRSAVRVHNKLIAAGRRSRLTIGPWVHGARTCWSPGSGPDVNAPSFSLDLAVKRFFDCELRGLCNAFRSSTDSADPPLHFFLQGVEGPDEWVAGDDQWPPPGLAWHDLYMKSAERSLEEVPVKDNDAHADFRVNFRATTGKASRWNLVLSLLQVPVNYPTRKEDGSRMISRVSAPLQTSLDIIGSVQIELSLELLAPATATDAAVFVYLEDVDPKGSVTYITEGQVRAAHPLVKTHPHKRVGAFDSFERSFLSKDLRPMSVGVKRLIPILLEPIAYRVATGHHVRLSIAGADADNFYLDTINQTMTLATIWRLYDQDTRVRLPVKTE